MLNTERPNFVNTVLPDPEPGKKDDKKVENKSNPNPSDLGLNNNDHLHNATDLVKEWQIDGPQDLDTI